MLSIAEITYRVQQREKDPLLNISIYFLGLIWENHYNIYLFDSDSKDEHDNLWRFGTAVLLKFDTLYLLENYIQSIYYNAYPLTLYFSVQFINFNALQMRRMQLNVH